MWLLSGLFAVAACSVIGIPLGMLRYYIREKYRARNRRARAED